MSRFPPDPGHEDCRSALTWNTRRHLFHAAAAESGHSREFTADFYATHWAFTCATMPHNHKFSQMATRFVKRGDFHQLPWSATEFFNRSWRRTSKRISEEMPKYQSDIIYHDRTIAQEAAHFICVPQIERSELMMGKRRREIEEFLRRGVYNWLWIRRRKNMPYDHPLRGDGALSLL